jgi:hypothetical protein
VVQNCVIRSCLNGVRWVFDDTAATVKDIVWALQGSPRENKRQMSVTADGPRPGIELLLPETRADASLADHIP